MRLVDTSKRSSQRYIAAVVNRGELSLSRVMPQVERILARVRKEGDKALLHFARKLDGVAAGQPLRVSADEMARAWTTLDPELQRALQLAEKQIRDFARQQMPKSWTQKMPAGHTVGQLVRPLASVGCYVPGGRHPLPSTLLMTVIPAQVAGVQRVVVVSPGAADITLAAAHLLGITEMYRAGGAQAVAMLAYGTESVKRVDKIAGPGNAFVTAAKQFVWRQGAVGIDMLAGPTEIVVASEAGSAKLIAADLVAQAEHDPAALAVLVTTNKKLATDVLAGTTRQSRKNEVAQTALRQNGYVFLCAGSGELRSLVNQIAPEHLTVDSREDLAWVTNAGSVFVGPRSPQPMGDYISGPNHTLPTGGLARLRGGLSVLDFVKLITVQEHTHASLATLGPAAEYLAEAEGLTAHANAIRMHREAVSA